MNRYEISVDATTAAAIDTLRHDAETAGVSFTDFAIANPNDFGFPVVSFSASPDDARRYETYYDCELDDA